VALQLDLATLTLAHDGSSNVTVEGEAVLGAARSCLQGI
jgi:hypothetical protein